MLAHLPILAVVLPLFCAPLCLLLRREPLLWAMTFAVSLLVLGAGAVMLMHTGGGHVMHYAIGGWQPPWGIAYKVGPLNALMVLLLGTVFSTTALYAHRSFARDFATRPLYPVYSAFLVCQSGFLGIVVTDDLFNIFVFLEMASLSSYALVAAGGTPRALTAAYRYLLVGTVGAVFFLLGIGYLYLLSGTLNLSDLALRVPFLLGTTVGLAALAFVSIGLLLKSALFPLHLWLPNAYAYAPNAISAMLSATSSKVALYLLIRLFFPVFGIGELDLPLPETLLLLATLAVVAGSLTACFQHNAKRMMAYSSVGQIGYIVLGIGLATPAGVAAGLVHVFNHAVIKCSLFMTLGCIVYQLGGCTLAQLQGLSRRMPWTAAALVAGGISLVGVPLTSAFISKWYLVSAALESGAWYIVLVILAGSLIGLAYVWRLIEAAYSKPGETDVKRQEAPLPMLLATWGLLAVNFYNGVNPSWLTSLCLEISQQLVLRGGH